MEPLPSTQDTHQGAGATDPNRPGHRRMSSGGGLLSKLSFMRAHSSEHNELDDPTHQREKENRSPASTIYMPTPRAPSSIATALQQQKTRRRRGSLRKVALLGRGAQRERREAHRASLSIDVKQAETYSMSTPTEEGGAFGLGISDITPRPSMDGYASRNAPAVAAATNMLRDSTASGAAAALPKPKVEVDEPTPTSPTMSYTTTDDEDVLHMGRNAGSRKGPELASLSSGSDGYFGSLPRRRTISRARSPLSLSGLASTPLLPTDDDWDYSETEWWGWVILVVTWVVFVIGMGSCFSIWSWAWDVGTTPYAPPELEDDPTLPITGYYPALIILTCVMAWVWVVIAWVGMKYFRHAKISGD
ncbi:hypothetical protein N8I77_009535 [Diaporthe amygdali]|uniref:Uncharacterized protein n=1 Tax=Phomopsis amygdali TaxID=1214568 RepID=A0AAD9W118_PHOAM|nr:uncharacterized protein J7T55_007155 [Diaporthe amygdali]KAJ0108037.1 hypothetical protein J7T55_007155 [Diaporthe amygdali]KAK2603051.1 hypothetical protein N8I77_009535 [Diaporthe amygdali]